MGSVNIENVSKVYGEDVKAVNNASLKIKDKEFLVLVGPSGCGKSTLLRMIAGLEEITDGTISIGERVVNHLPPKDRNIAMVFQNYALYPHMTVYENMAFGLQLRKIPAEEVKSRVHEVAELLDLSEFLQRKPKALSGGQRQRVAVGRAIVRKPDVFLFDEPLSNLDAKLRVQMRIELIKLHQGLGVTVIYVTHDQVEAMTMGDRIVIMNKGVIQQMDTPLNVYNHPLNLFVAGFIGSPAMNFFEGTIADDAGLKFVTVDFELRLPETFVTRLNPYKERKVKMGIRPEHLKITLPADESSSGIKARIELIELMGNESYVYLQTEHTRFTVRTNEFPDLKPNSNVFFEPDYTMLHFFDLDTSLVI
ncbi:MAG: sn-glycerol-3-phosphate ABC transporter ATP-binding protein UgpC [Pseudomonadota bacterium]